MNIKRLKRLQIYELCQNLLEYYQDLLTTEELSQIFYAIQNVSENNLSEIENLLLPIVEKIWVIDLNSGKYKVISWNKYATSKEKGPITFATISESDNIIPFCGMTSGIEYEISYDALIGALPKDGATLIEDISKKNDYTIGTIGNQVINSYNGATKLITPKQLIANRDDINYPSKHNELILNSALINKIGDFELDEIKRSA